MYSPRPILKRSSSTHPQPTYAPRRHPPLAHAAVHFPPSPTLTRTYTVHSPTTYDRSPIVVGPNSCALPERGGRTYTDTLDDVPALELPGSAIRMIPTGHRHPKALQNITATMQGAPAYPLPPLIADCSSSSSSSSDSDESDGQIHSLPEVGFSTPRTSVHGLAIPIPTTSKSYSMAMDVSSPALSFLPHPPSPEDEQRQRRRRRPSPNHSSSSPSTMDDGFSQKSTFTSRTRGVKVHSSSFALCSSMSGLGLDDTDSGCLGGF